MTLSKENDFISLIILAGNFLMIDFRAQVHNYNHENNNENWDSTGRQFLWAMEEIIENLSPIIDKPCMNNYPSKPDLLTYFLNSFAF